MASHKILAGLSAILLGLSISPTLAEPAPSSGVGVLMLYKSTNQEAKKDAKTALQEAGCQPQKMGKVNGAQGPLGLPQTDRFALLFCKNGFLNNSQGLEAVSLVTEKLQNVVLVEGLIPPKDVTRPKAQNASDLDYVFKLSVFNNSNSIARVQDYTAVNALAEERPNKWVHEAKMTIVRAHGIKTPDELDIIYYQSAAQGQEFRKNNPDVLKRVGEFNKMHLDSFTYISASLDK